MAPLAGQPRCYTHSATTAASRAKARRRGGQRTRTGYAPIPAPVATIGDLQGTLAQVLGDVLRLPNSESRGRTVARLLVVAAKLIEDGDLRARIEALEQRLGSVTR